MQGGVLIKSFPNGINVILDPDIPFEELYVAYAEKFRDSSKFFGAAKRVLSFEGRVLSDLEKRALIEAIEEYTQLDILCVLENDEEQNRQYLKAANAFSHNSPEGQNQIYKGCIYAGQNIETKSSIVVLGDVNPGAEIKAGGSVVVLGCIYGDVKAGLADDASFIAALDFKCTQVGICNEVCKVLPKSAGFLRTKPGARIVFLDEDGAQMEEITKDFLMNLPF